MLYPDWFSEVSCLWLQQPSIFADPQGSQPHGGKFNTSCNLCLRDFSNLPYHGLLDWRLALDMARIALSSTVTVDLSSSWNGVTNPWVNLLEGEATSVLAILRSLGYSSSEEFDSLRGYVRRNQNLQRVLMCDIRCGLMSILSGKRQWKLLKGSILVMR